MLSYTELLFVIRRQPVFQRIYLPRSEPDRNAAATRHISAAATSLKDGQVSGNRRQQHFPNNTAWEPALLRQAGALLAFILGVNEERLIDLGFFLFFFFQDACRLSGEERRGAGKPSFSHNRISIVKHHEPRRQIYLPFAS